MGLIVCALTTFIRIECDLVLLQERGIEAALILTLKDETLFNNKILKYILGGAEHLGPNTLASWPRTREAKGWRVPSPRPTKPRQT